MQQNKETTLTILTVNCQGLGDMNKRRDVLKNLKCKNYNLYFLQDTHFVDKDESFTRTLWGYKAFFSSFKSNSSLLNVVYKIASGCIAERLKTKLNKLINRDQTGFIKGRFIGENIRLIYDLMHYTEYNQIPGLLMLIDFEKAFDSIAWKFIYQTLDFFNFGPSLFTMV